ncbi:cysteine hydrolase family protein [Thermogemmatispora onikobensis]|uniref:cysteine hydrolase family protein n=1 Tax=Thermogemmatispora onikobensis TaxID=732234 RepID=UPI000852BDE5|nr:isochorismatase family cysteine hydrolase [Thermogemmatispora onikobensis]
MNFQIDPRETALLVIDVQNAFCHPRGTLGLSGVDTGPLAAIIPHIRRLVEVCKVCGIPDIWTIQHHFAEDCTRELHRITPHTQKRARIACQPGTWDAEIVAELQPLIDERSHLIEKHKFSAFYGTRLEVLLRILGRRLLLITGTTTNACIDTTVREAYMRDYDIVVVRECVGGIDPAWHDMALAVWERYIGAVVSLDELLPVIERVTTQVEPQS